MTRNKVLVIGLDGATFDLIQPWVAGGKLPVFEKLMKEGAHGRLQTVPNTDTAPAWVTFATGLDPANHGLFHEFNWSANRQTLRPVRGGERHGEAFWRVASDAGRGVVVINVPFTYPAEPVNGVMVAGVDSPSEDAPELSYPADFIQTVRRELGDYHIASRIQVAIKEGQPDDGLASAYAVAERHTEVLLRALSQTPWELAVLVYSIPDEMQHFFWQQMVAGSGPQRDAIYEGYRFIERQIERLLAHAGDGTTVVVISDHGFGPICATPEFLAEWLEQEGFLRYLAPSAQPLQQRITSTAYGWLRHRLGEGQKAALRRLLPSLRNRVETDARFAGIDWPNTTAYVGASPWEIWINTQGREAQGAVGPGAEYEQVRDALIEAMLKWRDPVSGQARVRAVYPREAVYSGRFLELAPDITLEWNPEAAPPAHQLPGNFSRFDADHQPEGVLLMAGPTIRAGALLDQPRLMDVAPTILNLLGVPVPNEIDGRVLAEALFNSMERTGGNHEDAGRFDAGA